MMQTLLRNKVISAISATGLVLVGMLATGSAAEAATAPRTYVLYSSDAGQGAKGRIELTWVDRNSFKVTWWNEDVKADGKGAILQLGYLLPHSPQGTYQNFVYDHITTGSGVIRSSTENMNPSAGQVLSVSFSECNGGSRGASLNCNTTIYDNPLA